jgi:DNA-binding NarL/FixJ family response regulator
MLHVDDAVALLAIDRTATNALLVRAPAMVAALGEWFDLLWDDEATLLAGPARPQQGPTDEQRQLLRLMYGGASDSLIANRLNTSVSTVRRRIRALCAELGVAGRFAAGAAAAKRGWL